MRNCVNTPDPTTHPLRAARPLGCRHARADRHLRTRSVRLAAGRRGGRRHSRDFDDDSTQFYVQAGIEQKWIPLGKTTIFGEYQRWDIGVTQAGVDECCR